MKITCFMNSDVQKFWIKALLNYPSFAKRVPYTNDHRFFLLLRLRFECVCL